MVINRFKCKWFFCNYAIEWNISSVVFYLKICYMFFYHKKRKFWQYLTHYCKWKPTVSQNVIIFATSSSEGYTVVQKTPEVDWTKVPETDELCPNRYTCIYIYIYICVCIYVCKYKIFCIYCVSTIWVLIKSYSQKLWYILKLVTLTYTVDCNFSS